MAVNPSFFDQMRGFKWTPDEAEEIKRFVDGNTERQVQTTYGGIAGGRTQCDEQQAHTSREEAIRNASYHGEMAAKSYQAAAFFEANPAFEEFIRLIRCGAIQL